MSLHSAASGLATYLQRKHPNVAARSIMHLQASRTEVPPWCSKSLASECLVDSLFSATPIPYTHAHMHARIDLYRPSSSSKPSWTMHTTVVSPSAEFPGTHYSLWQRVFSEEWKALKQALHRLSQCLPLNWHLVLAFWLTESFWYSKYAERSSSSFPVVSILVPLP